MDGDTFRIDLRNEEEGRIASCNEKEVVPCYPYVGPGPAMAGLFLAETSALVQQWEAARQRAD
jgi:hypothetical protein